MHVVINYLMEKFIKIENWLYFMWLVVSLQHHKNLWNCRYRLWCSLRSRILEPIPTEPVAVTPWSYLYPCYTLHSQEMYKLTARQHDNFKYIYPPLKAYVIYQIVIIEHFITALQCPWCHKFWQWQGLPTNGEKLALIRTEENSHWWLILWCDYSIKCKDGKNWVPLPTNNVFPLDTSTFLQWPVTPTVT